MKVKVILIDSIMQDIREVYLDKNLDNDETRKLLKILYFDYASEYKTNFLFHDLLGFDLHKTFFKLQDEKCPWVAGSGILSEVEVIGDDIILQGTSLDVDYIKNNIVWCQVDDDESRDVLQQKNQPNISFQIYDVNDFLDLFENDL